MQIDTSIMGKEEYLECIKKLAKQFCNIYIYGAGVRGKMLFELLKDNQINVKAYVVTDKNMNRDFENGLKVIDVSSLEVDNNTLILLGVKKRYEKEITKLLEKKGCKQFLLLPNDVNGWGSENPDISDKPVMEITTKIGCSVNCKYYPQKLLLNRYWSHNDRPQMMSFEMFKRCIDKLDKETIIQFCGYCEPFLNSSCAAMIQYADKQGFKVSLYTTLVGLSEKQFNMIKDIPFINVVLHLPDENNFATIPINSEYLTILNKVIAYKRNNGMPFVDHACCQTQPLPMIKKMLEGKMRIFSEMTDRAGNLDDVGLVKSGYKNGTIKCSRVMNKFVLLPSGEVTLCCMDYGLENILGSLETQEYSDIIHGNAIKNLKNKMSEEHEENCICRKCLFSVKI